MTVSRENSKTLAYTFSHSSLTPAALLLTRDLMEGEV